MKSIHELVFELRNKLGYTEENGCCHGFSIKWIEACLLGEEERFHARVQEICHKANKNADFWPLFIAQAKEKVKSGEALTAEEEVAFDILCFYESLELYQSPESKTELLNTFCTQVKIDRIANLAACEKILEQGGLKIVYSESGIYTVEELRYYLDALAAILDALAMPGEDIGMVIYSHNHTMALMYNPRKGWKFMDPNQYPSIDCAHDTALLVQSIEKGFSGNFTHNFMACNLSFVTKGDYIINKELARQLSLFKSSHLAAEFIQERARRKEKSNGVNLVYMAARYGDVTLIEELAKAGANLNCVSEGGRGFSPVWVAAFNGHAQAITALAKHGADLNRPAPKGTTPLLIAASYNHVDVVAELAKHGAALNLANNEGETPISVAVQKGYIQVIAELAGYKADLNSPNKYGITPALIAAQKGNIDVLSELKIWGVDFDKSSIISIAQLNELIMNSTEDINTKRKEIIYLRLFETDKVKITAHDIAYIMGHSVGHIIGYKGVPEWDYEDDYACDDYKDDDRYTDIENSAVDLAIQKNRAFEPPELVFISPDQQEIVEIVKDKKRQFAIAVEKKGTSFCKKQFTSCKKMRIDYLCSNNGLFSGKREEPAKAEDRNLSKRFHATFHSLGVPRQSLLPC